MGVRGACEAIHQALREALEKNPDKAVLQLDLINAFNTVDRATAIQELANNFPTDRHSGFRRSGFRRSGLDIGGLDVRG